MRNVEEGIGPEESCLERHPQEVLSQVMGSKECKIAVVKSNICGYYFPSREIIEVVLRVLVERCEKVYFGDTPSTLYSMEKRIKELNLDELDKMSDRLFVGNLMRAVRVRRLRFRRDLDIRGIQYPALF